MSNLLSSRMLRTSCTWEPPILECNSVKAAARWASGVDVVLKVFGFSSQLLFTLQDACVALLFPCKEWEHFEQSIIKLRNVESFTLRGLEKVLSRG